MENIAKLMLVLCLTGCATTVAVVDTTASTAVYATKATVSTTYDVVSWPFKKIFSSDE